MRASIDELIAAVDALGAHSSSSGSLPAATRSAAERSTPGGVIELGGFFAALWR
jgi:hypothetical protein